MTTKDNMLSDAEALLNRWRDKLDLTMERIDTLDARYYGGDIDTLVHLIDFEAVA